jgi:hypothetical protein
MRWKKTKTCELVGTQRVGHSLGTQYANSVGGAAVVTEMHIHAVCARRTERRDVQDV